MIEFEKLCSDAEITGKNHALCDMMNYTHPETEHTSVFVSRAKGELCDLCNDKFYIATDDGRCVSRLWNGWGKHRDAVGNFGDFFTLEEYRGEGLGKRLLKMWYEDIMSIKDKPIGFFCTSAARIAKTYEEYGMTGIFPGQEGGPSYMPLGDSPKKFDDLCDMYYTYADTLTEKAATFEYRHEIDLLLKFYFMKSGIRFGFGDIPDLEYALVHRCENVKLYFAPNGHCVGWSVGEEMQLHPKYRKVNIIHYGK